MYHRVKDKNTDKRNQGNDDLEDGNRMKNQFLTALRLELGPEMRASISAMLMSAPGSFVGARTFDNCVKENKG